MDTSHEALRGSTVPGAFLYPLNATNMSSIWRALNVHRSLIVRGEAINRDDPSLGELSSRCFVIDPVCAFQYGHSLNSLKYFSQLAGKRWQHVEPMASYHLPVSKNEEDGITRFFDFYYDKYITIKRIKIKYNGSSYTAPSDPMRRALADFSNFLFYKVVTNSDSIILPNTDIYSLSALLALLEGLPAAKTPALFLRFIGVMEHAKYFEQDNFDAVAQTLKRFKERGYFISVSAETPTLSRLLAGKIDAEVWTTPYPLGEGEVLPLPPDPFTVLCGGSARADKGFGRLPAIIDHVGNLVGDHVHFIVQNAPPTEQMSHLSTIQALSKMRNVTMLDGILSFSDIIKAYARTTISIMPYDPAVYAERGSAILMESIMFGRLAIGQADTAFAEQILLYNSGEVARTDTEFARAIVRLASMPREYLREQAVAARHRYLADVASSYDKWLGERR